MISEFRWIDPVMGIVQIGGIQNPVKLDGWNGYNYEQSYEVDEAGYYISRTHEHRLHPVYDCYADSEQDTLIGFEVLYN